MLKITGELLRRKLAELVNALNLVLTFGADQPMLYTYNSFYRKYSYIRILYCFFFRIFCFPCSVLLQRKRFTQENTKPPKMQTDLCIKLRQIYIFFPILYRLRVFFKDVLTLPTESRRHLIIYGHNQYCQRISDSSREGCIA